MKLGKIAAVVVLYNPTQEELENINSYSNTLNELILIDNSPISNEEMIREAFGDDNKCVVKYLFHKENIGLCAGMNQGVKIAAEDGCDWCYTNNPDSKFGNDITSIYENVILSEKDSNIAILGPQYSYDRKKLKKCQGVYDVDWLMMSGNLVNISAFQKVGGFDERLFLDGLDIEFCLRLKKNGYRVLECREAVLIHKPAITKEKKLLCYTLRFGWDKPERYYYQFRSYWYIIKKYKDIHSCVWMLIKLLKIILLFDNKKRYLYMFYRGVTDVNKGIWGNIQSDLQ